MLQGLVVGAGNFEPWGSGSSLGWVIACLSPPRGKMKWVPPKCQGNMSTTTNYVTFRVPHSQKSARLANTNFLFRYLFFY